MRDAACKILNYTNNMLFEDFLSDDKTIDAVVRNLDYNTAWKIKEENIPELIDYLDQAVEGLR